MSEQVKLSECLQAEYENGVLEVCAPDSDLAELWEHRVARAEQLEAEVEQLREERDFARQSYDLWRDQAKEYARSRDTYRAAVAELRQALINDNCGDIGVSTRAVMLTFLDKLPKDTA